MCQGPSLLPQKQKEKPPVGAFHCRQVWTDRSKCRSVVPCLDAWSSGCRSSICSRGSSVPRRHAVEAHPGEDLRFHVCLTLAPLETGSRGPGSKLSVGGVFAVAITRPATCPPGGRSRRGRRQTASEGQRSLAAPEEELAACCC